MMRTSRVAGAGARGGGRGGGESPVVTLGIVGRNQAARRRPRPPHRCLPRLRTSNTGCLTACNKLRVVIICIAARLDWGTLMAAQHVAAVKAILVPDSRENAGRLLLISIYCVALSLVQSGAYCLTFSIGFF